MRPVFLRDITVNGGVYVGRYAAGSDGHIYSIRHGIPRKLAGAVNKRTGYRQVSLYVGEGRVGRSWAVHVLIAVAFLPPKPPGPITVNHKDLDKSNNQPTNLEWMTKSENVAHFHRHTPGKNAGERNAHSKLTERAVILIHLFRGLASRREVAECWGVAPATVSNIWSGSAWPHIYRRLYGSP